MYQSIFIDDKPDIRNIYFYVHNIEIELSIVFSLLQLLLWPNVICVSTLFLTAISCSRMKTSITFATDHFVTIVFLR